MSEQTRNELVDTMEKWMRSKLELNAYKGDDWLSCHPNWLLARIHEEVCEMAKAIEPGNAMLVWSEAADVANMAAMYAARVERDVILALEAVAEGTR
jgi:NTP pyrophosphatase (non-canonical NTP hydrolase)